MTEDLKSRNLGLDELVFSPETGIALTPIHGVLVVKRPFIMDERGSLQENFRMQDVYDAIGEPVKGIMQTQTVYSVEGALRGMHAGREDKFCVPSLGKFFVALTDVRRSSETFGQSITLTIDNESPFLNPKYCYFIRRGIAHGYMVLGTGPLDEAEFSYFVTSLYDKETTSRGFRYDDAKIGIEWPGNPKPLISTQDLGQPSFEAFTSKVDQNLYK